MEYVYINMLDSGLTQRYMKNVIEIDYDNEMRTNVDDDNRMCLDDSENKENQESTYPRSTIRSQVTFEFYLGGRTLHKSWEPIQQSYTPKIGIFSEP